MSRGRARALFQIAPTRPDGTASMPVGAWLHGPDGRFSPGTLGILADGVLAFAIVAARPDGKWPVSSEITMDFLAPVLGLSGVVHARSQLVEATPERGLSRGELLDSEGRTVAICTQRGRFVDLPPGITPADPASIELQDTAAADLVELIGARISPVAPDGAGGRLEFASTDGLSNLMGNLHGGVSLCASELLATQVLQSGGTPFTAASIHMVYARPIPAGSTVTFTARLLHRGRTSGVVEVIGANAAGKPCTIATVTGQLPA